MFEGMTIPFIMLLIITIGLLLERKHQEDKVVEIYEEKFEQWKEQANLESVKPKKCKELVGLVFSEGHSITIETFNQQTKDKIERKKYTLESKDIS
jgi:hypothetical protein